MVKKRVYTTSDVEPPDSDDLKRINGVGPAVENRLHGVGIYTFAQLVALSPADIAASLSGLSGLTAERIIKQDWLGQARKLAFLQSTPDEPQIAMKAHHHAEPRRDAEVSGNPAREAMLAGEAQKNVEVPEERKPRLTATFAIELVLNEDKEVLRTELVHLQSKSEETWAGWQASRLIDFLVQHSHLSVPPVETIHPFMEEAGATPAVSEPAEPALSVAEEVKNIPQPVQKAVPISVVRLRELQIVPEGSGNPRNLLSYSQPFDVCLTLDFANLALPGDAALNYKASIHARKMDDHTRQLVGEARGTIVPSELTKVKVEGLRLLQGTYRLEAAVTLTLPARESTSRPELVAQTKGSLLQIY